MGKTFINVVNRDLEIASKNRYEGKITVLEQALRESCTPDQLGHAENIAENFRKSMVFKYISAENSIVNVIVWKTHESHCSLYVSFKLNGKEITMPIPDADRVIYSGVQPRDAIDGIKEKILQALTEKLTEQIMVDVINAVAGKKGNKNG